MDDQGTQLVSGLRYVSQTLCFLMIAAPVQCRGYCEVMGTRAILRGQGVLGLGDVDRPNL